MISLAIVLPDKLTKLILQTLLDKAIFDCHYFTDIDQALVAIETDQIAPQLIIVTMDINTSDNTRFLGVIRGKAETQHSPVLLITSETNANKIEVFAGDFGITEVLPRSDLIPLLNYLYLFSANRKQDNLQGKVLLVEDSQVFALYILEVFKPTGIEAIHCTSGEAALKHLTENKFDLIITDFILLGEMTGLNLIQQVKSNPQYLNLPILAITGLDDEVRKIEMLNAGASDVSSKPISPPELLSRSGNLIRQKKLFDAVVQQQKELTKLAHTDQLTELYNRHFFISEAKKLISHSRKEHTALSFLLMDVDHFKKVNDNHGHDVGDLVLQRVAKILTDSFAGAATVARYGGEEFVVLLPGSDINGAKEKAEFFREKLADTPIESLRITVSIGVSFLKGADVNIDNLIKRADELLYVAKEAGRNCVKSEDIENKNYIT